MSVAEYSEDGECWELGCRREPEVVIVGRGDYPVSVCPEHGEVAVREWDCRYLNDGTRHFKCPFCGSRVYRGTNAGRQAYRCNDLTRKDCPSGHEPVGRTKAQVRRAYAEFRVGGVR